MNNDVVYNGLVLIYKKEWNFVICSNMDGLGGHYTKWDWSEKDKYYMESKKYNKLLNKTRKKQIHR